MSDDQSTSAVTDMKTKADFAIQSAKTVTMASVLSAGRAAETLKITAFSAVNPTSGKGARIISWTLGSPAPREPMGEVLESSQGAEITKNMTQGSVMTSALLIIGMELAQSAGKSALQVQNSVVLSAKHREKEKTVQLSRRKRLLKQSLLSQRQLLFLAILCQFWA